MARSFEEIYQIAPEPAVRRLLAFREKYPFRIIEKEGMIYHVWDTGNGYGERAMVFLPSGMGHGEIWFPYLMDLGRDIRCIAFSLPECKHMQDFARQIHAILEDMGVKEIILVSTAIGGLIGQMFVRVYPLDTIGQVLCTCGAPCKELPDEDCLRWTARKGMALRYKLTPFEPMRQSMGYQTFHQMCPEELQDSMTFWRAFISETYEHYVYKKQYINLNCVALPEIYAKKPFEIGDMDDWKGKTLILESSGDQYYGQRERKLLKKLYPGAQVEEIGDMGQFALMARESEIIARLREFIGSLNK